MLYIISFIAVLIGVVTGYVIGRVRPRKADGVIEVIPGARQIFQLEINTDPDVLAKKDQVVFELRTRKIVEEVRR